MNRDYLDLLELLLRREARFMVVGAYALAVHGRPRATGDIDIWIDTTGDNPGRVYAALSEFGAPIAELKESDLTVQGTVFQVGVAPRRIDIITRIDGVTFETAWPGKIIVEIQGNGIPFIGRDDFLANKMATGRLKDLADAEELKKR
jgi:hypothetical protein